MLKKVVWKEGALLTFQLKENLFTIGQMLKDPYVCFYAISRTEPDIKPQEEKILFIVPVARNFLQKRTVKKENKPKNLKKVDLPSIWIRPIDNNQGGFPWKGGDLVEIDHSVGDLGIDNKVIKYNIDNSDKDTLSKYELTNIWTDGALLARLILCFEKNQSIDPLKEKIFFGKDSYGIYEDV